MIRKMGVVPCTSLGLAIMLLALVPTAYAGYGGAATPNFPNSVTVGQNNVAVSVLLQPSSTGETTTVVQLASITLIPSCGARTGSGTCASPDPGVFAVSATGTGSLNCTGTNFTIAQTDATTGQVTFTPSATISLDTALNQQCQINFTVNVLKLPTLDCNTANGCLSDSGLRTAEEARFVDLVTGTAVGTGTGSDEITVFPLPSVGISKTCANGACGDTAITFTGTVTNTGPTTLATCTVTDAGCTLATGSFTGTNIAPGGTFGFTCTKPATPGGAAVGNTASVSCTDVNGNPASNSVDSNTCSIPPTPTATIVKSCSNSNDCDDTGIRFTITVTNGSVPISGGTITDAECVGHLDAGESFTVPALGAGGTYAIHCTLPGTAGSTVTNPGHATVAVTSSVGSCPSTPSNSADNVSCTIPPRPTASISKVCSNSTNCADTNIRFTITVTNGTVPISGGTITDAECVGHLDAGESFTVPALAAGGTYSIHCTLGSLTPGAGGTVTNPGSPSVTVTGNNCNSAPATGQNNVSCTIPACPCNVSIDKKVAPDTGCDGVADSAFVDTPPDVVVNDTQCVVFQICVTNTGGQDLTGVMVTDDHLGINSGNNNIISFGDIPKNAGAASTVCKEIPGVVQAPDCTGGTSGHACVCQDVSGTNEADISSATCKITNDSACNLSLHPGSVCSDTVDVACQHPSVAGCRMTGGSNNFTTADTGTILPSGLNYTTGGQIGAPVDAGCRTFPQKGKCVVDNSGNLTCSGGLNGGKACLTNTDCPADAGKGATTGPWGNWEHQHHSGPDDSGNVVNGAFSFQSGTAAAPDQAYIKSIICADTGWCVQARPAPDKQIFWDGYGVFQNIKVQGKTLPLPIFASCGSQPLVYGKNGGTLHYYKAHVGDFGEPAGTKQNPADNCSWVDGTAHIGDPGTANECKLVPTVNLLPGDPDAKFTALHPACLAQDCKDTTGGGCPDWYEIEIHCSTDPLSPIMYSVHHFITDGNFQLHPSVGNTCSICGDGICDGLGGEDCTTCPKDCGVCP